MAENSRQRGQAAEQFVANRLKGDGYTILDQNWATREGEIDIIALDGDVLVFVEVRSRKGDQYGTAEESVSRRKLERICNAGLAYIESVPEYADHFWRVDLVAVTLDRRGVVTRYNHYANLTLD